jgi:hypothetical protein
MMRDEDWQVLNEIVDEAMGLAPEARQTFLETKLAADPATLDAASGIVARLSDAESFLEPGQSAASPPSAPLGQIGVWHLGTNWGGAGWAWSMPRRACKAGSNRRARSS